MKFFFNQDGLLDLREYGIEIPLSDGRIKNICNLLKIHNQSIETNFKNVLLTREDLERVHTKDFVSKIFGAPEDQEKIIVETFELLNSDGTFNRYDPTKAKKPLAEIVDKVLLKIRGTMTALKEALSTGETFHLGGGYHHAMSFGGRGFCLLNDIVIAARWSQRYLGTKLIWVIDVDAHKGDGTAELTLGDSSIRTLSIHMKNGWPLDSEKFDIEGKPHPWFIESDIEIGIETGEESHYLNKLFSGLLDLEALDERKPDLAIVVQGSDPYEKDALPSSGLLKLSKEIMLERDLMVYEFLKTRNIPQTYVMAGGYGDFAHEPYCQFISNILQR
jgi:acetoin utilization deacetylase AcuC-like enzyme